MTVRQASGGGNDRLRTLRRRRPPILFVLTMLDVFVLGGAVALVLVNRQLSHQLAVYVPHSMDAASAILDFMDDLFPYYVVCIVGLLALVLITLGVWAWLRTDSWLLRYGVALLVLTILVVGAWALLSHGAGGDPVPPLTPTPVAAAVSTSSQAGLAQERGQLPRWGAVSKDTFASSTVT
jgi:hypothetical protein